MQDINTRKTLKPQTTSKPYTEEPPVQPEHSALTAAQLTGNEVSGSGLRPLGSSGLADPPPMNEVLGYKRVSPTAMSGGGVACNAESQEPEPRVVLPNSPGSTVVLRDGEGPSELRQHRPVLGGSWGQSLSESRRSSTSMDRVPLTGHLLPSALAPAQP